MIPGSGRSPGEGNGNPLQYSCLENPHGQRSLSGYSPWGCKELDMTEVTKQYNMTGVVIKREDLDTERQSCEAIQRDGYLQAKEQDLRKSQCCQHLDLRLLAFRTGE